MQLFNLLIQCFFLGAFLLTSCNDPSDIGGDFFEEENFEIEIIDSLSLKVSTLIADSLATSTSDRLLVGYKEDPYLGKVTAIPVFQVVLDNVPVLEEPFTKFDSITLWIDYDGYHFYDTLASQQHISVYRLRNELELNEEAGVLYNNSPFAIAQHPLGQKSFPSFPRRNKPVEIRLADELGLEIIQKIINNEEDVQSAVQFVDYFKGIALIPNTTQDSPFIGLKRNTGLRIYYTDTETLPVKQVVIELPANNGLYYNHIQSDRTNTPLANLNNSDDATLSKLSNEKAFIQAGVGLSMRVEVPYIKEMLLQREEFILSRAELEIRPITQGSVELAALPTSLQVVWVDEQNNFVASFAQAFLEVDTEFGRDTRYILDVTDFVNTQLERTDINEDALVFSLSNPPMNAGVNRLVFGDGNAEAKMELKLFTVRIKDF